MHYSLTFKPKALKEWHKLDNSIKEQLKKKLKERLKRPEVQSDKLSGFEHIYKIKLRNSGFRLAYEVQNELLVVLVIKIGKRDKFYNNLEKFI